MGGIGHHHIHPWDVQNVAFILSVLFPLAVGMILGGEWRERRARG